MLKWVCWISCTISRVQLYNCCKALRPKIPLNKEIWHFAAKKTSLVELPDDSCPCLECLDIMVSYSSIPCNGSRTCHYKHLQARWWLQPLRKKIVKISPMFWGETNNNKLQTKPIGPLDLQPTLVKKHPGRERRGCRGSFTLQQNLSTSTMLSRLFPVGLSLCVNVNPPIFLVQTPPCPSHVGSFRPIWLGTKEDLATLSMTRKVRLPKAQQIHGESPAV